MHKHVGRRKLRRFKQIEARICWYLLFINTLWRHPVRRVCTLLPPLFLLVTAYSTLFVGGAICILEEMYSPPILPLLSLAALALAACPYMEGPVHRRDGSESTGDFLAQFELDDTKAVLTSDVGGPIGDQFSLKAG